MQSGVGALKLRGKGPSLSLSSPWCFGSRSGRSNRIVAINLQIPVSNNNKTVIKDKDTK